MNRCLISSFISVKLKHDHRPRCNTCYQRQQVLHLASNSMLWLLGWRTEGHLNHFCSGHVHPKTGSAPGDRVRIKSRVLNQRPGPHPENTSAPRVGSAPRDRVLIQRPGPHPETGSTRFTHVMEQCRYLIYTPPTRIQSLRLQSMLNRRRHN